MQSWLNWYSIGGDQAKRVVPEGKTDIPRGYLSSNLRLCVYTILIHGVIGSMTVSKTVGSGSSPSESAMHEWRNLEDAPDLESDAEMHVGSNPTSCTVQCIRKDNQSWTF